MQIETLSLLEGLYILAMDSDDVDATNITARVRNASEVVVRERLGGRWDVLHAKRSVDSVDDILILVTENGHRDIFR
ncbi:hypothetical protein [Microbacterium caowuchunii]|uniref:Uncharacterized protein n=1 Tax=Microbacterium caowuchunii TaxID=2614638 RepID=A0A5N0TI49_9MICO|nr:hypothetical protein [Microbacterium caowuchunii]KAA9133777.1 hypothetical protein F6B40_08485 [Microbacterium caowuchunii]